MSQIQTSTSHAHQFRLPSTLFSDPVNDSPSDTESFDADDLYGSDSDAEIIRKESPDSSPPASEASDSDSDMSVRPLLLCSLTHPH
jgi:hypothetical protein